MKQVAVGGHLDELEHPDPRETIAERPSMRDDALRRRIQAPNDSPLLTIRLNIVPRGAVTYE